MLEQAPETVTACPRRSHLWLADPPDQAFADRGIPLLRGMAF